MGDLVQLFKTDEGVQASRSNLRVAVAEMLESNAKLEQAMAKMSLHLDSIDCLIDSLTDADTRYRYRSLSHLAREKLTATSIQMSEQIRHLSITRLLVDLVVRHPDLA